MRKLLAAGLVVICGLCAAPSVATTYNILGNCDASCASVGMSRGDLIFGQISINRPTIVIGGTFNATNLQSFSVRFGNNTISNANAVGTSLIGVWGNDLDTIAALDLRASTSLAPNLGLGLELMLGASIVSTAANCAAAVCDSLSLTNPATISSVALQVVPGPAPVPLPASLLLLAAGIGSLLVVRQAATRRPRRLTLELATARCSPTGR